jgi:hypothetical protein
MRWIMGGVMAVLGVGCATELPGPIGSELYPEGEPAKVEQHALKAQAARGARVDGNLYLVHFDGETLNSLGREKLELMVQGGQGPLVVYLDSRASSAAEKSVRDFLASQKSEAEYRVERGGNPDSRHEADLAGLKRLEQGRAGASELTVTPASAPTK